VAQGNIHPPADLTLDPTNTKARIHYQLIKAFDTCFKICHQIRIRDPGVLNGEG
jgi:hypothetical protein